jgi:hypothetical protein
MGTIQSEHFTQALVDLLDETFENVHGFYLDRNTSLFETLAGITAEEASIPVGGRCATLAAQARHAAFYLDVIGRAVRDPDSPKADWGEIWRTVERVTPEEWQSIQDELRTAYTSTLNWVRTAPDWPGEDEIGTAMAVVAHTAYHLGEIRQALCFLRP